MSSPDYSHLPLVYACSGCSTTGQMANAIAQRLDRHQIAEMSCLAGVLGEVPGILRTARSGRKITVLDGCNLACARNCLRKLRIEPALHIILTEFGAKKDHHEDFNLTEADFVFETVKAGIDRLMAPSL